MTIHCKYINNSNPFLDQSGNYNGTNIDILGRNSESGNSWQVESFTHRKSFFYWNCSGQPMYPAEDLNQNVHYHHINKYE